MNAINIKNSSIDKDLVAEQLKTTMAQIPNLGDLATSGPTQLHNHELPSETATDLIRPLISYIPKTILKETEFTSPTPIIGPLMIKIRQTWHWMSTKWYMIPILMQQSDINSELIVFLIKSAQVQEKQAATIAELEERITQLENQQNHTQK